ncbi:Hypothetical protein GbCGDNIH6_1407 [Granulibacter bethesdensis]|uniref:SRPBCC family protein n=1 Tax=Granulibacter bethesdensis TaxID=364410 RepID=UPI00090AC01D|nr:SRPBCC family protein [Granulibacter bethesdensis]APH57238.1 Hypothetical protein GbCGDNIH6_1407 [Granulibacter bethesdensis]
MLKHVVVPAVLASLIATPALAVDVTKSVHIAASPAKVWSTIGKFCGIATWHPAVTKCELVDVAGAEQRTLSLKGGGTIVEQQVDRNDAKKSYTYTIQESPLPVANYKSTISVTPAKGGSEVAWVGHFDAKGASDAEAAKVIAGIYEGGLAGIAKKAK